MSAMGTVNAPVYRLSLEAPFDRLTLRRLKQGEHEEGLQDARREGRERWEEVKRMGFLPLEHLAWRERMKSSGSL